LPTLAVESASQPASHGSNSDIKLVPEMVLAEMEEQNTRSVRVAEMRGFSIEITR